MGRLGLLVCVGVIFVASAVSVVIDPRGARPVEQGTRGDKCATQKEWPFCTSDEWGSKCPSGCRIQGLLDKYDHSQLRRIEKIRNLLDQNKAKHRSADQVSKQTYEYLKEKLIVDSGNDNSYFDLAQNLRQRIIDMKIKIDRQLRVLGALKERVRDQVVEMQRLEVDIDIKLRSCKGSCKSYAEYEVDRESYVELNKQVDQLAAHDAQSVETVSSLYVMKSRPLQGVLVDPKYKSGISGVSVAGQQKEDLFPEVKTVQLVLEQEGSSSSPATISKHQGTSSSQSRHSSSSTSSITDIGGGGGGPFFGPGPVQPQPGTGHSITRIEGGGGDHFFGPGPVQPQPGTGHTTTRVEAGSSGHYFGPGPVQVQPSTSHTTTRTTCTKTVRRTVVHTKDGPVERTEEVMGGGPECQGLDLTKGGMGSFFPSLSHVSTSSSSSSSSSSLSHTGGTKGSLFGDHKSGFGDPFASDFAAFRTANTEDDIPDFHARSVKSSRFERHADYVGKDCVEAYQNHLNGETNGLFKIKPGGTDSTEVVEVYCRQEGLMGGWLLVQQRESGVLSFNRTWAEYRKGFGSVDAQGKGEFWLGNQNLHLLTNQGETMLKVELEDWEGGVASAEYIVRVGSEEEGYPLHVSGYTGDAGDALIMSKSDMASYLSHNGMKFSTFDSDNDKWEENCAEMYGGGWWYNNCQSANLNGMYYKGSYDPEKNTPYEIENGVVWVTYKPATYSLKTVRMFIRSAAF
ncbi:fibrinogen alpha chain [Scomber japonicus]|uniref:fibrinogen alpha chain n=1 Tax=Scomber japonicus TaxID=13676 RepID=UPI002305186C|nr:fibrinogen alpha chain [Scomber japonicus]